MVIGSCARSQADLLVPFGLTRIDRGHTGATKVVFRSGPEKA